MGSPSDPGPAAARVLATTRDRAPTLGTSRLICIDGPAGSGKTTLAAAVAALSGATVVHLDDLYPGWSGMRRVEPHVLGILQPLSAGAAGRYRRYDWHAGRYAEEHVVVPAPLLVLEGVAAGSLTWASWTTTLVWVEARREERLRRGIARDGEQERAHWVAWMAEEQALFAEHRTRERADVVVRT